MGSNARLSDWTGVSAATVKGWQADEGAEHRRVMSATAQRLLATLAYMRAQGMLDEAVMNDIKKIEQHMVIGKGRLIQFLETLTGKKIIGDDDED